MSTIPVDKYEAWRAWLQRVDALLHRSVRFAPREDPPRSGMKAMKTLKTLKALQVGMVCTLALAAGCAARQPQASQGDAKLDLSAPFEQAVLAEQTQGSEVAMRSYLDSRRQGDREPSRSARRRGDRGITRRAGDPRSSGVRAHWRGARARFPATRGR